MKLFENNTKTIIAGCIFALLANTSAFASNFWSDNVWTNPDRGFLYYPSEAEKPKKPKFLPLEKLPTTEAIKAEFDFRKSLAIVNPTEENVRAFYEANHFVQEKSAMFSDMYRRVAWQNPQWDYSTRNPAANFAQVAMKQDLGQKRTANLASITRNWGLVYFYRADCNFCKLQSPLVQQLQKQYGFEVLAVSLDGSDNPHFPEALPDNGISKVLTNGEGLQRVPALFMVNREQTQSFLVSSGVLSLEDMVSRIETLATQGPGESLFGGSEVKATSLNESTLESCSADKECNNA